MHYQLIKGDLLDAKEDFILQQNNCIGVKPHGLSQSIALKYPYANPYCSRKAIGSRNMAILDDRGTPGTIQVFKDPKHVSSNNCKEPTFVSLFAQYGMGKPYAYNNGGPDAHPDDADLRRKWFKECLGNVAELSTKTFSVALPHRIGCGLAFGDWKVYEKMINDWAKANPHIKVVMYQL